MFEKAKAALALYESKPDSVKDAEAALEAGSITPEQLGELLDWTQKNHVAEMEAAAEVTGDSRYLEGLPGGRA